jgi:GMP synthase (glutamine-hydrolysing)
VKPIIVLRNDAGVPPGYLAEAFEPREMPWHLIRLDGGEPLPEIEEVGGVVALGGLMGAYDVVAYPYLEGEKQFLADCVAADVPVLGICLGAQLLADALGGRAYLADTPEATFASIELTAEGEVDAVTAALSGRTVLRLHQDTWDLPPGGTVLAEGGGFQQAFRFGSALGIQPHPEADPEIVAAWLALDGTRRLAHRAGTDPDELMRAVAASTAEGEETANAFFDAWLSESRVASRES